MYFTLFELLRTYIYGEGIVLTPNMDLTLTLLASIGCIFVVALPFILVWRVIHSFC